MLYVHKSNRLDALGNMFNNVMMTSPSPPFQFDLICAPDGIREQLKMIISDGRGMFMGNIDSPRRGAERLIYRLTGQDAAMSAYSGDAVTLAICRVIFKNLEKPKLGPLHAYFGPSPTASKVVSFASSLANLFGEYMMYRPNMLMLWTNAESDWQPEMFREITAILGEEHFGKLATKAIQHIVNNKALTNSLPERVMVFGITSLPPLLLQLYAAVSTRTEVHLFVVSPSEEYFATSFAEDVANEFVNPLLRLLGTQPAQFQSALIDVTQQTLSVEHEHYVLPAETSMLLKMQHSILCNRTIGDKGDSTLDSTIQFHECPSPDREVDVMKNCILDVMKTKGVQPDEIVVMAPDINEYAALVDAAFMNMNIPYSISDEVLSGPSGIMEAAINLLKIVDGRLGLKEVFSLLHHTVVKDAFALTDEEIRYSYHWCKEAGIRSCIDEPHRRRKGLAAFKENTWRFGLERLFLGVALDENSLFRSVSPVCGFVGTEASVLGKLTAFLEHLFSFSKAVESARSVIEWMDVLSDAFSHLIHGKSRIEEWAKLQSALQALSGAAKTAAFSNRIDFAAVRTLVISKLKNRPSRSGVFGGIRFSSFRYMRGESAKVLLLLGMAEGQFPRESFTLSYDLIATTPAPLDRNEKHDSYHMFLDAFLAPSESFVVLYSPKNRDAHGTAELCVPARRLRHEIANACKLNVNGMNDTPLHIVHPAMSFDVQYFKDERPFLFSYSRGDLEAAIAKEMLMNTPSSHCVNENPFRLNKEIDRADVTVMSLSSFLDFWKNPSAYFLQNRLGMFFPSIESFPEDDEPITVIGLEEWKIGKKIIDEIIALTPVEQLLKRIHSMGILPPGHIGTHCSTEVYRRAVRVVNSVKPYVDGSRRTVQSVNVTIGCDLGRLRIVGSIEQLEDKIVEYSYSHLRDTSLLRNWFRYVIALMSKASDGETNLVESVLVGRKDDKASVLRFFGAEDRLDEIASKIIKYTLLGIQQPIPFLPELSAGYVREVRRATSEQQISAVQNRVLQQFAEQLRLEASPESRALLDGGIIPHSSQLFHQIAQDVCIPMLDHLSDGEKL